MSLCTQKDCKVRVNLADKEILIGDTTKLIVKLVSDNGEEMEINEPHQITFTSSNQDVATVDPTGRLHAKKNGETNIYVNTTLNGYVNACKITIMVGKISNIKSRPSIYTAKKREVIRENLEHVDWAKDIKHKVIDEADHFLNLGHDYLWRLITPQTIPRSYAVNQDVGSPITGNAIEQYGNYPYILDPINTPWKIKDPSSGFKFPTNDFGKYYDSGLDSNGIFRRELADSRLLVNTLYPDKGEKWGVDDGAGWVDSDGNKYTFIAYYNHWGLWYGDKENHGVILKALTAFRNAYIYTGDKKYAEAGIIMLDRIADIYPEMDATMYPWDDGFRHSSGKVKGMGKIVGCIWETELASLFTRCYDAFFPALSRDSSYAVRFLSRISKHYSLGNLKYTATGIKKNIEDNIIQQIYPAVRKVNIHGNIGLHHKSLGLAAVVLEESPESEEWVKFIFQPGDLVYSNGSYVLTGGNVDSVLMDQIDRDGYGMEAAPSYNFIWLNNLLELACILQDSPKFRGYDLFSNVKFKKMMYSMIDLVAVGLYTLQIGDSGSVGSKGFPFSLDFLIKGFEKYQDPYFIQALYYVKGDTPIYRYLDLTSNVVELLKTIETVYKAVGPLKVRSNNLTGFGLAILRDGTVSDAHDYRSDIWLYYGRTIGSHPHRDALNLGLHAFGQDLLPDMGYVSYADGRYLRRNWERNTPSHNTVMVDQRSQNEIWVGTPQHFDDSGNVKLIDVEASHVYPQTTLFRRTTALIRVDDENSYVVDFFRVEGGNDHHFCFYAGEGDVSTQGLALNRLEGTVAGKYVTFRDKEYDAQSASGFNYLYNVQEDCDPSNFYSVNWKVKTPAQFESNHLKLSMLGELDRVILADGDPPQNKPGNPRRLKFLLAHRQGQNLASCFMSVIQPYRKHEYILDMELLPLKSTNKIEQKSITAKALKITLHNGRVDYIINSLDPCIHYRINDKLAFQGFFGVYSEIDGTMNFCYSNDGPGFFIRNKPLKSNILGCIKGKVVKFTEKLCENNWIVIKTDQTFNIDIIKYRHIYIENDLERNAVYEIQNVMPLGSQTYQIDIGSVTLVRKYKNKYDRSKGYVFDISQGADFKIPLSTEIVT